MCPESDDHAFVLKLHADGDRLRGRITDADSRQAAPAGEAGGLDQEVGSEVQLPELPEPKSAAALLQVQPAYQLSLPSRTAPI